MRQLITYFVKYPAAGNLLLIITVVMGLLSLFNMKSTFFPPRETKTILIDVVYPGASPEEIEEGVVLRIEDNLRGITGLDRFMSTSRENAATITVEILDSYDVDVVLQDVKNAVDQIPSFPTDMEPPVIYKRESISPAYQLAISGPVELKKLKEAARRIENDLLSVDGISKVSISGYPDEEIEIAFSENKLRAYDLTFQDAANAVRNQNLELSGGTIKTNQEELLIRARSKSYYADQLRSIVIKNTEEGELVRLQNVAEVRDRWADNPNRSYLNNEPSVIITISNTIHEDILFITDFLDEYVADFNENNAVIKATTIRDFSITLQERIDLLVKNGLIGAGLVLLMLALFLNLRLAFWVAVGIPVSFCGMFIIANLFGISINVISLFGMIIVVGILVDDGIVIAENIFQHAEKGKPPLKAAVDGTMEVFPAVVSAIVTTIIAFSIFFFIESNIGSFITDMAFVVIVTLAFSLIEGAFILPEHIAHSKALHKADKSHNLLERKMAQLMNFMRDRLYVPSLKAALKNKFVAVCLFFAVLILSFGLVSGGLVRTTFFPYIDRDEITVTLEMPAGTRDYITENMLSQIEQAAWEANAELSKDREDSKQVVESIEKNIGPQAHLGSVSINLLTGEERGIQSFKVINAVRDRVGEIPEAEKLTYEVRALFGKPVSISLLSNNLDQLDEAEGELKTEMENLPSLKDVADNNKIGLREINVTLKEKAYMLGLSEREIINQVRQGFFGAEVQRLQRGLDEVKVWVRYDESERSSIGNLEDMRIRVNGAQYPLRELATLSMGRGVISINHLNGKREIRLEAELANPGESAPDILAEIESAILPSILAKYPDVSYSLEGQARESAKTQRSGTQALLIALMLIIAVIVFTFRSFSQAIAVVLIIPFGLIGVILGHYIQGHAISIFSLYGIIALIGIIVNDSLVLVTALNNNIQEGKDYAVALLEAGRSRFRPILLTTVTTVAGLGPLILETSFQAQFLIPMAISVAYGLAVATFVTLVALPLALITLNSAKVYFKWLLNGGNRPARNSVETAHKELSTADYDI